MKTARYDNLSDNELLEYYYQSKDQQWIGILLERYTLLLLGVCMKYLKNEEEARDAVQQIFLKVLTEASKYKIDFFKSWVYMVAKNYCLMKLRSRQGRYIKELDEATAIVQHETNKHDLLDDEKTYSLLEQSISELNAEQKQCVTLFYLKKNSYQQITEATGFSLMQVKSYIQNGKGGKRPGSVIGTMSAVDINYVRGYLAGLVKKHNLPPKILVVHRFTQGMITNYKQIKLYPETQIVIDMDGWGYPAKKIGTYKNWIHSQPIQFTGFKLFYVNDTEKSGQKEMMSPAEVLRLKPAPIYIQYQ